MSSHTGVVPSREGEKLRGQSSPTSDPQRTLGPCSDPITITTGHNSSAYLHWHPKFQALHLGFSPLFF